MLATYSSWGACSEIFDPARADWADDRTRLREALSSEEDYSALADSTLTAYYTAPDVVDAVWDGLKQAGYSHGEVLEPGCGTGGFIGRSPDTSQMVGIDVDPVASRIATQLYPEALVRKMGFEDVALPKGVFTAAVGNVPFGRFSLYDPEGNPRGASVHNHFLEKSVNLVAPGGYVAMITSAHTSDALRAEDRAAIIERADLVSAVRLPTQAFQRVAGTSVTSDLLIFRVRDADTEPSWRSESWIDTETRAFGTDELTINRYIASRPDHVLGDPRVTTGRFGAPTLVIDGSADGLGERITSVISADIAADLDENGPMPEPPESRSYISESSLAHGAGERTLPGTITYEITDGNVEFRMWAAAEREWQEVAPRRKDMAGEWVQLLDIRDSYWELRAAYDEDGTNPAVVAEKQADLSDKYDTYVEKYGPISRGVYPPPRKPTKAQAKRIYNDLLSSWRADNGVSSTEEPPAEVVARLTEESQTPVAPTTRLQPHIDKLANDPLFAAVMSLEDFNDETQTALKTDFFTTDPARRVAMPERADTLDEAVRIVNDSTGTLDLEQIGRLLGTSAEDVAEALPANKLAFRDPESPDSFIPAPQYLSGFVVDKLAHARVAGHTDPRFAANIEALEAVQPERVEEGITVRPGMTWLPEEFYRDFAAEKFGVPARGLRIKRVADNWSVDHVSGYWHNEEQTNLKYGLVAANNAARAEYNFTAKGSPSRFQNQAVATNRNDGRAVTALEVYEATLNLTAPVVNFSKEYKDETGATGTHSEATSFVARKSQQIRREFAEWVMEDPERRNTVVDLYNKKFNSFVAPNYDGSNREIPGLGERFRPYEYQLNAVERMTHEPGVLLNHVVGAGKTGTMLMGASELKRLGIVRQPWLVVPNHLTDQISREAQQWFPSAKILSGATATNPVARRNFVAQTTAGDWDFVIVPQSVFERIPVDDESKKEYINGEIRQFQEQMVELTASGMDEKDLTVKRIRAALKVREKELKKLLDSPTDAGMTFNDTPCDYIIVDEAHHYKNLMRQSKVDDLSQPGSQRASDLDMKLKLLRENNSAAGLNPETTPVVTFATGTPIANNLAEIWVMGKYLRPDLLERLGIDGINAFGASFTDQVTDVELSASGAGLVQKTRTATYLNVGELATATSLFMDVVTSDQITAKLPTLINAGQSHAIEFEVEQEVRDFISDLAYRSSYNWDADPDGRKIEANVSGARIDNPLKIASDGRMASLHGSLVNLDLDGPGARVTAVADAVFSDWLANRDNEYLDPNGEVSSQRGGLQVAFCDRSVPGDGFNMYDAIKDELVARGMQPDRIRFVHDWDHDRAALFRDCNEGHVDLIIGSTEKMGTGANIQTRAVSLHHIDIPWRPADLAQRNGRIIRQGNQNDEVQLHEYIGRNTYDALMWQAVYRKERFIAQFYDADRSVRTMEALNDSGVDAYAHNKAIATGDSRYVDLMTLDKEVEKLEQLESEWVAARSSRKFAIQTELANVKRHTNNARSIEPHAKAAQSWTDSKERTWGLFGGRPTDERGRAVRHVTDTLAAVHFNRSQEPRNLVTIGGLDFWAAFTGDGVTVGCRQIPGELNVRLDHTDVANAIAGYNAAKGDEVPAAASGLLTRIENKVKGVPDALAAAEVGAENAQHRLAKLESAASPDFAHAEELRKVTDARDTLKEELSALDADEAVIRAKAERVQRMQQRGRIDGYSLRLVPTPTYASAVEGKTQAQVTANEKISEALALHDHGLISSDEMQRRYTRHLPATLSDDDTDDTGSLADRLDHALIDLGGGNLVAEVNENEEAAPPTEYDYSHDDATADV